MDSQFRKNGVDGVDIPFRTSTSEEMRYTLKGQQVLIRALAAYKQWKIDKGYGNQVTYTTLSDQFRKDNASTAAVIDLIIKRK